MTGCENLCTAEKCAELEERIKSLENILGTLQREHPIGAKIKQEALAWVRINTLAC